MDVEYNVTIPSIENIYIMYAHNTLLYLLIQYLYSALFTNKRALMRCLTNKNESVFQKEEKCKYLLLV